ncbi:MAG: hypothetical protein ACTSR3_01105 [Candidatus Helarchaeota archaeon]
MSEYRVKDWRLCVNCPFLYEENGNGYCYDQYCPNWEKTMKLEIRDGECGY